MTISKILEEYLLELDKIIPDLKIIDENGNVIPAPIPDKPKQAIKSHEKELAIKILEGVVQTIEGKYGKQGVMNGSFGYQGIVMGITAFQTGTDKMRDDLLSLLSEEINSMCDVIPPENCTCASFFTIRKKHKPDCPCNKLKQ